MINEAVRLVKTHSLAMHSPYYSNPCSASCPVCNMDKEIYDRARDKIKKEIDDKDET